MNITGGVSTRLKWAGAWVTSTVYTANDQVSNGGDLFVCTVGHIAGASTEPGVGADWATKWARSVDMLTADQVAAAAGSGTPSGANKFVTADTLTTHGNLAGSAAHSLATTGLPMIEVNKTATGDLSAAECSTTIITKYGQGAAMTLTLPAAVAGLNFVFTAITTGYAIHIKAGASDKVYLDGVALDDGDKVSCAAPAVGNAIAVYSFKSGASSYDWNTSVIAGVWTDGGA